jgi:hypothetical protein
MYNPTIITEEGKGQLEDGKIQEAVERGNQATKRRRKQL